MPRRILVVEDDADIRRLMHVRLGAAGYDTSFAFDAVTAISVARKEEPDLIVLDLGLPGGDGYIVMERLRALQALSLVPVVVVSARPRHAEESRVQASGAVAFISKPIDNAGLVSTIRSLLGE